MINPTYTFVLSHESGGETLTRNVKPNYQDGISMSWDKQSGEQFFRRKLSGKLTFQGSDCDYILAQTFGTKFTITINISYDQDLTSSEYWNGFFYITDCEIDEDDKTCIVQPSLTDDYTTLLDGIDKEFDLIPLAPEIQQIQMDKRPCIQIYRAGESTIGCFLSGMWWEQECEAVEDNENDQYNELLTKYKFAKNLSQVTCHITGYNGATLLPDVTGWYYGQSTSLLGLPTYSINREDGVYRIDVTMISGSVTRKVAIVRNSDNVKLWESIYDSTQIAPVSGTGASGTANIDEYIQHIYCRILCDVDTITGRTVYPLPSDDMGGENRNYHYISPYECPNNIFVCDKLTSTPTEWGIYQPGQYYDKPNDDYDYYPVARNMWNRISVWYADADGTARQVDTSARHNFPLRNAYPLSSVISVLLGQINPTITHEATADYSQYLYGTNTILQRNFTLMITPKSNIVKAQYDQPAQKAPTTLKQIMEMLKNCFRCYCFVDEQKRFRIEHIKYFMNGGRYVGNPDVQTDLTQNYVTRNGQPWSYKTSHYSFDKPDMTGRYQFDWMDESTILFKGYPIDIISPYVNKESIENITVSNFSSDVDYIMLNPSTISLDGFVLMAAVYGSGQYSLPYEIMQQGNTNVYLQNGIVSFAFLQQGYKYDLPATDYEINGTQGTALGMEKMKHHEVTFPAYTDPDTTQLIKTALGNGQIDRMQITLLSRQAKVTLKYDTI